MYIICMKHEKGDWTVSSHNTKEEATNVLNRLVEKFNKVSALKDFFTNQYYVREV